MLEVEEGETCGHSLHRSSVHQVTGGHAGLCRLQRVWWFIPQSLMRGESWCGGCGGGRLLEVHGGTGHPFICGGWQ